MRVTPRLKLVTVCVSAALAQMMAVPALADSGKGVDTVIGNARNGGYQSGLSQKDLDASSHLHTPTGQLYSVPSVDTESGITTEGGWVINGGLEAGLLRSQAKDKNAIYDMYRANSNGFLLNNFSLSGEKADAARYFEVKGGGVGQKDQFYALTVGHYGVWKVKAFYNETPHVFTTTYRNLWNGVGTGNLTLLPGLTPGGTGAAGTVAPGISTQDVNNIIATANANANTELSIVRKKGGVRLDMNVMNGVKFVASYSNEKRKGSRAFGMVAGIGGGGGQATPFIEVPESIDYNTHDFLTSLQYADELNSLNVNVTASIFKNNIGTETIQIPFSNIAVAADGVAAGKLTQGRFDLVPDNKSYNASAEYERLLPVWSGRFNATVSAGTSRQDDALIAPSVNAIPGATAMNSTVNAAGGWDTTGSLSQQSAGTRIDNKLVDLGLLFKPADRLNVKGKFRYYETQNRSHYLACNPNATYNDNSPATGTTSGGINALGCNGVLGRILNDGAAVSLFQPNVALTAPTLTTAGTGPGTNFYIQNTPYDSKQTNYGLTADYKLAKFSSLNASLEKEDVKRSFRERDMTYETKVKLGYVNSGIEGGTLRLSLEHDNRTGSQYSTTQYRTTQMSGALYPYLPGLTTAATLPAAAYQTTALYETRRVDVADRRQDILNARFNYMVTPELDAGISGQWKHARYPDAVLGTSRRDQNSANLDLTYQPMAEFSISGFYSYQAGKYNFASATAGIAAGTAATASNPQGWPGTCTNLSNPGGCALPYNRLAMFNIDTKDTNNILGLDGMYDFGTALLKVAVTSARGVTSTSYRYGPTAAIQTGPNTGTGMPDMLFVQKTLDLNLLIPHNKKLSTHLLYHFEAATITDWHYQNLQSSPSASLTTTGVTDGFVLDQGAQNYHVHSFGVFLNYKM